MLVLNLKNRQVTLSHMFLEVINHYVKNKWSHLTLGLTEISSQEHIGGVPT
jgi:hypothetical protein